MLRKFSIMAVLLCLLPLAAGIASAQDVPPQPVDNLCDAGQAWDDGRCNIPGHEGASALAWECGWYMARVLDGRLLASSVPSQCEHLLRVAIRELCRSLEQEFDEVLIACIGSDGTGSVFFDLSQIDPNEIPPDLPFDITQPIIQIRFVANEPQQESDCPGVPGYTLVEAFPAGYFSIFTDEERASLGLGAWMCLYVNEVIFT